MCLEKIDVSLVARRYHPLDRSQIIGGRRHLRRMRMKGPAEVKRAMVKSNLIAVASQ